MKKPLILFVALSAGLFIGTSAHVSAEAGAISAEKSFSYTVFDFSDHEGWKLTGEGEMGTTELKGRSLRLDFSKGAKSISLSPTPVSMLGRVTRIRLKVKGSSGDHTVHFYIQTHFMTFHKEVGRLAGSGLQELSFDAPPGNEWLWKDGENDGEIHGPLRLLEIRIEGNDKKDICSLELVSLSIDGKVAGDRLCVLTSECSGEEKGISFEAKIRSTGDKPLKGRLSWIVRSWDQKELKRGSNQVSVAPGAIENKFTVNTGIHDPALRFAEIIFHLDIPGQAVPDADACWLARNEPRNDTSLNMETSFGMGAYLGRYHGRELEQMAQKARESGVKWIREDFEWGSIEPERGRFSWAFNDSVVKIARNNGISVCAIVAYWPSWTKEYTREGIDDYIIFLREVVRHYRNDIHYWEIWNEPNIFFWQGTAEMYAELLMKSYSAIKDEDPSALVLGISTSGIDFGFIEKMQQLQAPFDILTIHPYRSVLEEARFIEELKRASAMVELPGGLHRPVWITEMGWTTYTPHNSWVQEGFLPTPLRLQAQLIVRTYLSCIISGINPKVFWYDLRNDGIDPLNFEDNIGIMNRDFTPKPAYIAYSTMTRVLKGRKFIRSLSLPEGIFSGVFEDEKGKNGEVIAIWSPDEERNAEIEVNSDKPILTNTMGESSELKVVTRDNRQFVSVHLKAGSPVYIR